MRTVIYARFSSDQQSATSIADQASVCSAHASLLGLVVDAVYSDAAISGQSKVADRVGGRAMLADRFDVLIVESLDRVSRDAVDAEQFVRRLEHRGVRIIGVADGYDTASGKSRALMRMVRGAINETYIDDLREKTMRGMHGQFARGYHVTGLSYGYRSVVADVDSHGEAVGHRLEIVTEHAEIVREIFARYGGGESCQRIVADLNARGIAGPRGGTWAVSALYGAPAKGAGVLNNELYVGKYVWNRSRWVKDPDTGKRVRFDRPESEWRIDSRPDLRIVDDDTWRAVRARMTNARSTGGRKGRGGVPSTLFGGLLRCSLCGGAIVAIAANSYGCAARRDRGSAVCQGVTAPRRRTDSLLIDHLYEALRSPEVLARIEKTAADLLTRNGRGSSNENETIGRRRELEKEVSHLVDAIAKVGHSPALSERLRQAEAALADVKHAERRSHAPAAASDAPTLVRAVLDDLLERLRGELPTAREALRAAFGEIVIRRDAEGTFAEFESAPGRLVRTAVGAQLDLVAGARFELATFGL